MGLILFFIVFLSSCSKNAYEDGQVKINLYIGNVTRVGINSENADIFTPTIVGWEALNHNISYNSEPVWKTSVTEPINSASSGSKIELKEPQYYNNDRLIYTYIKSWYPQGTLFADGKVMFDNQVADGSIDVLYAGEIAGSRLNTIQSPLIYKHPLTQIKIKAVKEINSAPVFLKKITVKNIRLPLGVDVVEDTIIYGPPVIITTFESALTEVVTEQVDIGKPVMFKPLDTNVLFLDVETDANLYTDVKVTIDNDEKFIPGKAYTITLTFSSGNILVSATVSEWKNGAPGQGVMN